jgi:hypothetical protein
MLKKILPIAFLAALWLGTATVYGSTILYPSGGGTGISTAPTYGNILVGNAGGTYTLTATSSLGITGGSSLPFYASTTIGGGTAAAGLTTFGNGTTTGIITISSANTLFAGNLPSQLQPCISTGPTGVVGGTICLTGTGFSVYRNAAQIFTVSGSNNGLTINSSFGLGWNGSTSATPDVVLNRLAANKLNLGSTAALGDGTLVLGTVGIGTTSPYANLSIHAYNGGTNTTLFAIASSTAIGTTSLLTIDNKGGFTTAVNTGFESFGSVFYINNVSGQTYMPGTTGMGFTTNTIAASASTVDTYLTRFTSGTLRIGTTNSATDGTLLINNLGVGTTTPNGKFAISLQNGEAYKSNYAFDIASSTALTTTTLFSIDNQGIITSNASTYATSTFTGAIKSPCFSNDGITCISGAGGSGTVTNVATNATLTGGPITNTGTLGLNLANANTWTAGQMILASSTIGDGTAAGGVTTFGSATTTGITNLHTSISSSDPDITIGPAGVGNGMILTSGGIAFQTALANFAVRINGGNVGTGIQIYQSGSVAWGPGNSAPDEYLARTDAGKLALGTTQGVADGTLVLGTLGVGTTSPFGKLAVNLNNGDTNTNAFIIASSTNNSTTTLFSVDRAGSIFTRLADGLVTTVSGILTKLTLSNGFSLSGSTLSQMEQRSFTVATSTSWTGTTTIGLQVGYGQQWNTARCFTDVGSLFVDLYHGSSHTTLFNASTTVGTVTLSTNNTVTDLDKVYVDIGTPASSPTKVTCTIKDVY